jgi:hypothetical protein
MTVYAAVQRLAKLGWGRENMFRSEILCPRCLGPYGDEACPFEPLDSVSELSSRAAAPMVCDRCGAMWPDERELAEEGECPWGEEDQT